MEKCLPTRNRNLGFTLIELLVTVMILGIIMSLALPSFNSMMANNRVTTETNDLVSGLSLARSEAINRGVTVTLLSDLDTGAFDNGWSVFTDSNEDGARGSDDDRDGLVLRTSDAVANGVVSVTRMRFDDDTDTFVADDTGARAFVTFNARGYATPAVFRVCSNASSDIRGRLMRVSRIGLISILDSQLAC